MCQSTTTTFSENASGYDARNKDNIAESYICRVCSLLLREPVQLSCGHRYCLRCLPDTDSSLLRCNTCDEETRREDLIKDRGCQIDMQRLRILCASCEWEGTFKDYIKHLAVHEMNQVCPHCSRRFRDQNSCLDHRTVCENETVNCELHRYGCTESFARKDASEHLLSYKHQTIVTSLVPLIQASANQPTTSDPTTVDTLANSMQVLTDDMCQQSLHIQKTQSSFQSVQEHVSKLQVAVQETQELVDRLEPAQMILRQEFDSVVEKVEDQRQTSYDGTLLWKLTDMQQKIADAQSDKQTSIYSPPFFSSPTGYKMCVRLYLNGDGNARRSHMSLFFVLMRSDYDAVLEFPFSYKVTFCLYDQSAAQRHVIDSFRPDLKSASFERPRCAMNIASGIPKFFPLSTLQNAMNSYLHNDTMFIRIVVHFKETPKTFVPFMFSLNPGLPQSVQDSRLKDEIEKRARASVATANTEPTGSQIADKELNSV